MGLADGSTRATECPAFQWFDLESVWCALNSWFLEYPATPFLLGIAMTIVVWLAKWCAAWVIDRFRNLSGRWLLCILDESGDPIKFDLYQVRHRKTSITGSIQRLVSLEDEEQTLRSYELSGYTDGNNLVYSFWPRRNGVASFGTCALTLKGDNYFEGVYTRSPYKKQLVKKAHIANVCFTRSEVKVKELTGQLSRDQKRKIEKSVFVWYLKVIKALKSVWRRF